MSCDRRIWALGVLSALVFAAPRAEAALVDVAANDNVTGYDSVSGHLDSQSDGLAAFVTSAANPLLIGAEIEFNITLSGSNAFVFGSQWVGGNGAGADVLIVDPNETDAILRILVALEVNSITGGSSTQGPAGGSNTSITLGSLDEVSPSSSLTIVGGTLADSFGGVGGEAQLALLISEVSVPISDVFGSGVLSQSFSGTTNVQVGFVATPEPGTALLVAGGLFGIGVWRRNRKSADRQAARAALSLVRDPPRRRRRGRRARSRAARA